MRGRWRLFKHEAARTQGLGLRTFLALYVVALALGTLSTFAFDAVVFWPANAVMIAALLVLPRRPAMAMLVIGIALNLLNNLVRGDQMPFFIINVAMNAAEAVAVALVARRVGGAALDLRRPGRLWRFALLAVAPAVLVSAGVSVAIAVVLHGYGLEQAVFVLQRFFTVEALSAVIVTPALVMIASRKPVPGHADPHRARDSAIIALLLAVTALVFAQTHAPMAFLIFPFLLLAAFRLSPSRVALGVIGIAVIGGAATASGRGALILTDLPDWPMLFGGGDVVSALSLYYVFMLVVVAVALPVSTATTERRRLMQSLRSRTEAADAARRRAEQSDAAKSRFLALMSHEMRTPLNSIAGYAEVLSRRAAPDDRQPLEQIRTAGDALLSLVEDVLEISRGDDSIEAVPLYLSEVVEAALAPHRLEAETRGLSLRVDIRPDAAVALIGDRRRLRQALQHLIGNAVKFTPHGGVTVRADRLDETVLIAVSDTGCGLDADQAATLFEVFVQGDDSISRRHGGAGIGLAVVQRQARLLGGDVVVDSRPGEGATFTLRLPMAVAETVEPAPVAASAGPKAPAAAPRILVVDDHPANREVARLMLNVMGCEVDQAEDGDQAVRLCQTNDYDLILMDVRMPRIDGLAATRAIRALGGRAARTPILALTADAMPEDAARCLAAGMDGHLAKPIAFTDLAEAIQRTLAKGPRDVADAA